MRLAHAAVLGALALAACGSDGNSADASVPGQPDAAAIDAALPPDAGPPGVSGKVTYEDRVQVPTGGLGPIHQLPARGVSVSLVRDEGGVVLVSGRAADDGSYLLSSDAPAGTMVHVLAATTSDLATRPMKVTHLDGSVYGLASASFPAGGSRRVDLVATEAPMSTRIAEAFNVFDQMILGADTLTKRLGITTVQPLRAFWEVNSTQGTNYDGNINFIGGPDDDDGYDDAVVLHEFGHYVESTYGRSDNPAGTHGNIPADPRLAWSEGWSTYFSSSARANKFYLDTNSGSGLIEDLDLHVYMASPSGPMTQDVFEWMVAEILWDVGDGGAGDDDPRSDGDRQDDVMKIQTEYLHDLPNDRGHTGVDLVDWLDGWFTLRGLSTCAALRTIVTTTHGFPYDFNAPSAACP